MATGYGVCFHIVYGHRAISCMGIKRQAGQNRTEAVRGDRTEIVQCRFSWRAISADSARKSYGARGVRTKAARRWCGDFPRGVRSPYNFLPV